MLKLRIIDACAVRRSSARVVACSMALALSEADAGARMKFARAFAVTLRKYIIRLFRLGRIDY